MPPANSKHVLRAGAILLAGLGLASGARAQVGFLSPARSEAVGAGATVEVRWGGPCRQSEEANEGELVLSVDGGLTFPIRVTPEMSLCASGFRWRVPALPTAHARLALRTGSGETSGNERLEFVSEEFSIAAAGDEASAGLLPGAREWWTPQALEGEGTEDVPLESMAGSPEEIVAPAVCTDISEPTPPGVTAPDLSATPLSDQVRTARTVSARRSSPGSVAPLPLRL